MYRFKLTAPLSNRSNVSLMHTVPCGFDGIPTVRFGAVCRNRNTTVRFDVVLQIDVLSYGAVRCGFQMTWTLHCGSVLFWVLRRGSVRFSDFVKPTVRCDAVFWRAKILLRCGAHRTSSINRTAKKTGESYWNSRNLCTRVLLLVLKLLPLCNSHASSKWQGNNQRNTYHPITYHDAREKYTGHLPKQ